MIRPVKAAPSRGGVWYRNVGCSSCVATGDYFVELFHRVKVITEFS
jgi:hypothetical protein